MSDDLMPTIHRTSTNPRQTICGRSTADEPSVEVDSPDMVSCPVCARNATTSSDPAYFLLTDGVTSSTTVYNPSCYICRDPEFAQMGLPLCYPCPTCGAHVPADDIECDNGHDAYPERYGPDPSAPAVTDVPTGNFL